MWLLLGILDCGSATCAFIASVFSLSQLGVVKAGKFLSVNNMTQLDFPGQAVYRIQHHIPMLVQMHKSTNEISCSYYYFYYYDATITFILSCYVKNLQFMCE